MCRHGDSTNLYFLLQPWWVQHRLWRSLTLLFDVAKPAAFSMRNGRLHRIVLVQNWNETGAALLIPATKALVTFFLYAGTGCYLAVIRDGSLLNKSLFYESLDREVSLRPYYLRISTAWWTAHMIFSGSISYRMTSQDGHNPTSCLAFQQYKLPTKSFTGLKSIISRYVPCFQAEPFLCGDRQ